jgi:hypothetical protein
MHQQALADKDNCGKRWKKASRVVWNGSLTRLKLGHRNLHRLLTVAQTDA